MTEIMYDITKDPAKKAVTFKEIIDALERNGYTQAFENFFKWETPDEVKNIRPPKIKSACAVGQAAINLDLNATSLYHALNDQWDDILGPKIFWGDRITTLNDEQRLSIKEIAVQIREQIESKRLLDKEFYVSKHNYSGEI